MEFSKARYVKVNIALQALKNIISVWCSNFYFFVFFPTASFSLFLGIWSLPVCFPNLGLPVDTPNGRAGTMWVGGNGWYLS